MQINEFTRFKELSEEYGVIFFYSGYFTQNVIAAMGDALKLKLEGQVRSAPTMRKIFSTFIEMAQNIMHYSVGDERQTDLRVEQKTGAIAIGKKDDKYYILCGNNVSIQVVETLNSKLAEIHNMSKEEIKQAYKKQLQNEGYESTGGGAGLGFLTVARDAVEPIEYCFEKPAEAQANHSFFYIKATIV
jgi:hypothetical protein